jgi:hypothetical protein
VPPLSREVTAGHSASLSAGRGPWAWGRDFGISGPSELIPEWRLICAWLSGCVTTGESSSLPSNITKCTADRPGPPAGFLAAVMGCAALCQGASLSVSV